MHRSEVTAATGGPHSTGMIALIPSDEDLDRLVIEDGLPRNELHLTLAFLGESEQFDENVRNSLTDSMKSTAMKIANPVVGNAFAASMFNPHGEDPCWVMTVGGESIQSAREHAWEEMSSDLDSDTLDLIPVQHSPFVAHVTLTYTDDQSVLPQVVDRLGDITFDKLRLSWSDDQNEDFKLDFES